MKIAKDGIRSTIRVGCDDKVHKTFLGKGKKARYENEIRVLLELAARGCEFVPRILDRDPHGFTIITTNCGSIVDRIGDEKLKGIFDELKDEFGVVHKDQYQVNVTYDAHRGRFCVINFEAAEILGSPVVKKEIEALRWAGMTRSGKRKEENEDSISVFSSKHGWAVEESLLGSRKFDLGNLVFAVSDGMGGHTGGAIASQLVISELTKYLPAMLGNFNGTGSPGALLENAILYLHNEVLRIADSTPEIDDMGATVVCALFCHGELHFGHVGDSRLYRFRDGTLKQLTDDHSFVGKLQQEGKISEREARMNPRRNILTQAIGAQCVYIHPQVGTSRVEKGDWYLICSDGVNDGLWDKHIEQEFLMAGLTNNTPKGVASNLLERSFREAGNDDTTLFVILVE